MMKILLLAMSIAIVGLCHAASAEPSRQAAQSGGDTLSATIKGQVVDDQSGKPASGVWLILLRYKGGTPDGKANIEVFLVDGGFPSVGTDASGRFQFLKVQPGEYVIKSCASQGQCTGDYLKVGKPGVEGVGVLNLKAGDKIDLGVIRLRSKDTWANQKTESEQARQAGPFVLDARALTGYKSLCGLEPELSPQTVIINPGAGYSFDAGCEDFDNKPLVPVTIKVKNTSTQKTSRFTIPLLSEVTVNTDKGPQPAAALYFPWSSPVGFATGIKGIIEVDVAPGATIELLYLLPKTTGRTKIQIKDHNPLNLNLR